MAEPLETPPHQENENAEIPLDQLLDVAGAEEAIEGQSNESSNTDDLVQQFQNKDEKTTTNDQVQQESERISGDDNRTERPQQQAQQEQAPQTTEETQETEPGPTVKELEQQLEFYRMLYGEPQPQQQNYNYQNPQQQPQQAPNPQRQQFTGQNQPAQPQQPQQNIFDNIQISKDELYEFLSGEPERAAPVVRRFLQTATMLAQHNMRVQQQQEQQAYRYVGAVQHALYDKYKDLEQYRPIVKLAGDQVEQEYKSRGINKYPHELIDDIGKRARQILIQIRGNAAPANGAQQAQSNQPTNQPRRIPRQGETGGTRPVTPPKEKLSEQEKQMYDLLEDI